MGNEPESPIRLEGPRIATQPTPRPLRGHRQDVRHHGLGHHRRLGAEPEHAQGAQDGVLWDGGLVREHVPLLAGVGEVEGIAAAGGGGVCRGCDLGICSVGRSLSCLETKWTCCQQTRRPSVFAAAVPAAEFACQDAKRAGQVWFADLGTWRYSNETCPL